MPKIVVDLNYRNLFCFSVNNRSRAFTISGNSNNPVNAMIGSGAGPNNCANDWLLVPCAANVGRIQPAQALCTDRICGGTFSADLSMQASSVLSKNRAIVSLASRKSFSFYR